MIEFRIAEPHEVATIWRLRFEVFVEESGPHNFGSYERFRSLGKIPDDDEIDTVNFVAIEGDRIVGAGMLRVWTQQVRRDRNAWPELEQLTARLGFPVKTVVEFGKAFVVREFRRRGIHTGLLAARERFALTSGWNVLVSVVKSDNERSLSGLERSGWKCFARSTGSVPFQFLFKELKEGGA